MQLRRTRDSVAGNRDRWTPSRVRLRTSVDHTPKGHVLEARGRTAHPGLESEDSPNSNGDPTGRTNRQRSTPDQGAMAIENHRIGLESSPTDGTPSEFAAIV